MSGYNRNLISAIFTLFLVSPLNTGYLSAKMKSGYRFGNLTSMSIRSNDKFVSAETPVGIQFGAMYEIPFNRKLTFQSGLLFSSKGTDFKIDMIDHSIAPAYIEMPIHLDYYFGRRAFKVALFTGPYISIAFGGYKIDSTGFRYLTYGRSENKDLRNFDTGLDFGASINYKGFLISFQYGVGLRNVSPKNEMYMRNQVFGITIGTLLNQER